MKILDLKSNYPTSVSLILGFFDGIHAGHAKVIKSALNNTSVLITFPQSPDAYFKNKAEYIYPREYSYKLIEEMGVDYLYEIDFSDIVNITGENYLKNFLIKKFKPISISTGFNHTFGYQKSGNPKLLFDLQDKCDYKYYCIDPCIIDNEVVSSSRIKKLLKKGDIPTANRLLTRPFILQNTVIQGEQLGQKIGFPTANLNYPENIVKIPYGVYKVFYFGMPAIMNWGIKPTVGNNKEGLEIHIPNYEGNLYGKNLCVEIIEKIRDEKKFQSLNDLKSQIKEDIKECLK